MQRANRLALAVLMLVLPGAACADEKPIVLKDAPGRQAVEANCATCHSVDYIQINSPFLKADGWAKTVHKMIETYHAPIEADDAKTIVDYLSKNYGGG